jgi:hypothetical protein
MTGVRAGVVVLGALALTGCPSDYSGDYRDEDYWIITFRGDANAGDHTPGGLHIGFHISF